jgi:hypothetical protein
MIASVVRIIVDAHKKTGQLETHPFYRYMEIDCWNNILQNWTISVGLYTPNDPYISFWDTDPLRNALLILKANTMNYTHALRNFYITFTFRKTFADIHLSHAIKGQREFLNFLSTFWRSNGLK